MMLKLPLWRTRIALYSLHQEFHNLHLQARLELSCVCAWVVCNSIHCLHFVSRCFNLCHTKFFFMSKCHISRFRSPRCGQENQERLHGAVWKPTEESWFGAKSWSTSAAWKKAKSMQDLWQVLQWNGPGLSNRQEASLELRASDASGPPLWFGNRFGEAVSLLHKGSA